MPSLSNYQSQGWCKPNSFHVCITSYRLVVQDHGAFRRKKWRYFILDEAHHIKNFKSQRWQMLLNFNSHRRLLLTGTPLQNDLMELWSLMHFLMPSLFDSHRKFKDWFVNPVTGMIEGNSEINETLIQRLHIVLRPFLLRRLKCDVEKQLPHKYEHIVRCRLSKRQRFLYEEFMSLANTKETLAKGNFLSVINVLMQLRKVCNHPNLFEPRPIVSPFMMKSIDFKVPGIVLTPTDYNSEQHVNLRSLQLVISEISLALSSSAHALITKNQIPRKLIEEIPSSDDIFPEAPQSGMSPSTDVDNDSEELSDVDSFLTDPRFDHIDVCSKRLESHRDKLSFMASINDRRCKIYPYFYTDYIDSLFFIDAMEKLFKNQESSVFNDFGCGTGYLLCNLFNHLKTLPKYDLTQISAVLRAAIKSPNEILESMDEIFKRFVICVPGVSAPSINLHVTHMSPSKKAEDLCLRETLHSELAPCFNSLGQIMSNMRTSFPELRLIQYDCGKLQTLSELLWNLKSGTHRVLIFTQMSRMLDILEQFLNYHGHTYLRLDGSTKIDERQVLMERFNNDKRIFCFILSTRSGGVGVNLTGADTVIFYDSDWNPTMDAQAQDRCHRIGQTRDVHIYRLISERTIEENILSKARQKRLLGDVAIEGGNFTTAFFKKQAIQELFCLEEDKNFSSNLDTKSSNRSQQDLETPTIDSSQDSNIETKIETLPNGNCDEELVDVSKLEMALCKGEAEAGEKLDVEAVTAATEDAATELMEFDENVPLDDESKVADPVDPDSLDVESKLKLLVDQMRPIEKYAINYLETLHESVNSEELKQAEEELEAQKRDWEQNRIDLLKSETLQLDVSETLLTYPKEAKCKQVYYSVNGRRGIEEMPVS